MNNIGCMNCKKPVEQDEGKFFGNVFVCQSCFAIAESYYNRLEMELKNLLVFAKDAVRVALIEGKFHLSDNAPAELSKKELLEEILRMEQAREARATTGECQPGDQETASGVSTPPHVSTLAALGRSSSSKQSPQD